MKFFKQSLYLAAACILTLAIASTPLTAYMAPILGLLIIISIIGIIIKQRAAKKAANLKGQAQDIFSGSGAEVFVVTTALLLTIFLTGGLSSNLFFLLYFLLFGIVFLFVPETVFVLLLGLGIVFFQQLSDGDLLSNLIKLGSLAFLAPISYFFGREFNKREKLEHKINDKTGQILEDAQTLLKHTQNEDAVDEIDDIIERTNELRSETEKE